MHRGSRTAGAEHQGSRMDSPHLLGVGFLVLALTAPHPTVAMPSAPPAERTHDSSSGKTNVTVYHCRDCAISICAKHSSEGFAKIAETQNTMFSNEIIQLRTVEEGILMCFQQADTFTQGVYRIVWEKTGGVGDSCGNPSSTAFSENERATISTKENKICCEVITIMWNFDPTLKCYTEKSDAETIGTATDIPYTTKDGPREKENIGIFLALALCFVLCAAMTMWCYRKRHQYPQVLRLERLASEEE